MVAIIVILIALTAIAAYGVYDMERQLRKKDTPASYDTAEGDEDNF